MPHCRTPSPRPRRLSALAVLLLAILTARAALAQGDIVAGPMIGHVTDHSARIWMQLAVAKQVTITCTEDRGAEVAEVGLDVEGPLPFICDVPINNLKPNMDYHLQIKLDGHTVQIPGPELVIRTPPPPGEEAAFSVAFGSGVDAHGNGTAPAFKSINALNPRAFFFLGNTVFLPPKPHAYPQRYRNAVRFISDAYSQARQLPDLQQLLRSTACYGIWNDRDFGILGADKNWIFKNEAWSAFQHFWPNPDWGTPDNPGCYFHLSIADVDFFMLDDRMYRDPDNDPARKTMLGESQLAWLKKGLADSHATFKIIACGNQLLADYGQGDTWALFQPEQKDFLKWLLKNNITGVVLISGNGPVGEISALKPADLGIADPHAGYPLFELTTAMLAGKAPADDKLPPNPARQGTAVSGDQFATLDFAGLRDHRFITLRLRDDAGHVKLEQTLFAVQLKNP